MIEVVDGQRQLKGCKRIVVKIGSSLLTANGQGLDLDAISHWAGQIADLHNAGHEIILVSSGAVAEGMVRMKLENRPTRSEEHTSELQSRENIVCRLLLE